MLLRSFYLIITYNIIHFTFVLCSSQVFWNAPCLRAYAHCEGPDQPVHWHRLIRAFAVHWHYEMYQWRGNARMTLRTCVGWNLICAFCACSKTHFRMVRPIWKANMLSWKQMEQQGCICDNLCIIKRWIHLRHVNNVFSILLITYYDFITIEAIVLSAQTAHN